MKNSSLNSVVFALLVVALTPLAAFGAAGAKLTINGDDIIIYSGASTRYRPLATATKGASLPVSLRRVIGTGGAEFYKVLLVYKRERRVGYISTKDAVALEGAESEEDVDSYQSLALAKASVQFSFGGLKDGSYEVTLGYVVYPAPNFYLKGFAGQVISPNSGNFLGGAEVGLDQFLKGPVSMYGLVNSGAFFPVQANALFPGSLATSAFVQGGFGLRYTANEYAAVSLGILQSAFFSTDGAFLSLGYLATLEVGL